MKRIKYLVAVLCIASTATAQNTHSGYYNEGYLYRHEMNPAFASEQDYIAMPALGNVNFTMNGNLKVSDIVYNISSGGKTRTALFTNPQISADEALANIKDKHRITENLKLQILGFGFQSFGGYNTFAIYAREDASLKIPGSLFRLAKEGVQNQTYDLGYLGGNAKTYVEMAFGHSRQITEQLRVGAKFKLLFGIADVSAVANKAEVNLAQNGYVATSDAIIQASLNSLTYKMEEKMRGPEGNQKLHRYVSGIDKSSWGVSGFGMGIDLGAEYKINENWKVNMALLDLGYIRYKNSFVASTNGEHTVNTNEYTFSPNDDASNSFEREKDRLAANLAELYELKDNGNVGSRSTGLGATLNWGAEYRPNFYDKLTFGFLNSIRMGKYGWTDFRFSANVAPTKAVSVTANLAFTSFGTSFGWLINLHPNGFNFFLGMDHTLGKLASQGFPLSGRAQVNLGMNFPF